MDAEADHGGGGNTLEPQAHLWNASLSFITAASIKCGVELGIPDALHRHGGHMHLPDLAAALSLPPAKTPFLARLLRLLHHAGFFARHADGSYALNPSSLYLTNRSSPAPLLVLSPPMLSPWLNLSSWFHRDDPNITPFESANGVSLWEHARANPEFNTLFNEAMTLDSEAIVAQVVSMCGDSLRTARTVVDAGGGNGSVARAITEAFPHLTCTVLDLPHVVATQESSERVKYVGGDMLDCIPSTDVILLKYVLHTLEDDDCRRILERCREAIPAEGGKVIVVEPVITVDGPIRSRETQLLFDMEMMVVVGGREREERELKDIFVQTGFRSYTMTPVLGYISVIEVYP